MLLLLARNLILLPMLPWQRPRPCICMNMSEICLLLVVIMSDCANGGVQGSLDSYNFLDDFLTSTVAPGLGVGYLPPKWMEPYFDPTTQRNVTALMGKSAYLNCRVRNVGNKTVSWIRHRDIHILTVGSYTYTSDQRFQATHHQDVDDWTLQIKWAQKRDAGMYECQISTQPVRSFFVRLNVVVPTATILGGPDLHVDKGSTINLTCTVRFSPEPPAYIFWYHHEEVINYDSSRGGVSVITEKGDVTTSFLLIQNADLADSGKYSCAPSNADVASVRVHVLNGEHPEAMQTGTSGCQYNWLTICLLLGLVFCYQQKQQIMSLNHHSSSSLLETMPTNYIITSKTTIEPTDATVMCSTVTDELIVNKINLERRTTTITTTTINMLMREQNIANKFENFYVKSQTIRSILKIMSNGRINMNAKLMVVSVKINNKYGIYMTILPNRECQLEQKPEIKQANLPPMFILIKVNENQQSKVEQFKLEHTLASITTSMLTISITPNIMRNSTVVLLENSTTYDKIKYIAVFAKGSNPLICSSVERPL